MRRLTIGETGIEVSALCLGTALFGSRIDEKESFALMDAFAEAGGDFLDSAHCYADWIDGFEERCISEHTIGKWMKERGNRESIIVGTKGGCLHYKTQKPLSSREELINQIDRSRAELGVDRIDIYWLHRDDVDYPVAHFIDLLNEQCSLGHIRSFACSNWSAPRIREANAYAGAHDLIGFAANQMWWSLATPDLSKYEDPTVLGMDEAGMEMHLETGMTAIPYSSQAKGFFNKLDALGLDGMDEFCRKIYGSGENVAKLARIKEIAAEKSASIAQVALAWMLAQPFTTIPIVGCRTAGQLADTVKAANIELTEETVRYLEGGL